MKDWRFWRIAILTVILVQDPANAAWPIRPKTPCAYHVITHMNEYGRLERVIPYPRVPPRFTSAEEASAFVDKAFRPFVGPKKSRFLAKTIKVLYENPQLNDGPSLADKIPVPEFANGFERMEADLKTLVPSAIRPTALGVDNPALIQTRIDAARARIQAARAKAQGPSYRDLIEAINLYEAALTSDSVGRGFMFVEFPLRNGVGAFPARIEWPTWGPFSDLEAARAFETSGTCFATTRVLGSQDATFEYGSQFVGGHGSVGSLRATDFARSRQTTQDIRAVVDRPEDIVPLLDAWLSRLAVNRGIHDWIESAQTSYRKNLRRVVAMYGDTEAGVVGPKGFHNRWFSGRSGLDAILGEGNNDKLRHQLRAETWYQGRFRVTLGSDGPATPDQQRLELDRTIQEFTEILKSLRPTAVDGV